MKSINGVELSGKELGVLDPGESCTLAARPTFATIAHGTHGTCRCLLLTDRRLVISREKLFGKRKADFAVPWSDIMGVRGELWMGAGPQIQLITKTTRGDVELIVQPQHAVEIETAIRAGYMQDA